MLRKIFRNRNSGVFGLVFLVCLAVVFAPSVMAQLAGTGALAGKVIDASGNALPNATVTATSIDNGQIRSATTATDGSFKFDGLPAGNYRLKFEAAGFKTLEIPSATVSGTETAVLDEKLEAGEPITEKPTPAQQDSLPNAPSSIKTEPSLQDLGFPAEQTQANPREQALLDKRTHMLKIHQRMGLITTGPLIATVIASMGAGGKSTSTTSRDLHTALGGLTGDLYFMTAYYAIRAPKIPGTETRGPIRFHKVMAWIHGPGMIATPILGIMAFDQKNKGERVHGIAQAHGPVAIVTAGAFGAALLSVSVKF
jgi:carboxypeptidase family protein